MKSFFVVVIFILVQACGGTVEPSELFAIQLQGKKEQFQKNQSVGIAINNKKDTEIKQITYSIDGKTLIEKEGKIVLDVKSLGSKKLLAQIDFDDQSVTVSRDIKVLAEKAPEVYTYNILNTYPHDDKAYTQGLEFNGNDLYESTGKRGQSTLRKVNYKTGDVLNKIDLDDTVFGEGITIMNNKVYLLTWQSKIGYVYNLEDFSKLDTFTYGKSEQGWGLCNDGEKIYKSDGTEKIWYLDPETLVETGHVEIVTNKSIFNRANELEYVAGKIYANVYGKESMMIIDATSGAIEGVINFGGLKKLVGRGEDWDDQNSVLNGVAYHPEKKTFFVTGKNWDKLFEVEILKK